MIQARVIADSVNEIGNRLTTFVLVYPRWIHCEFLTHRLFSRNAASSRAIPIEKTIKAVEENTAMPISWGKNQKGMQASLCLASNEQEDATAVWLAAAKDAVKHAKKLAAIGVHKQIANRLLEPFLHMTTIVSATEWGNFFNLRAHKDAQPEFQELAFQMLEAYVASTPKKKSLGEWHLPFADRYINGGLTELELVKITVARAARVSYLNFEGNIDHEKDYALHDDLLASGHMSPFEHVARASCNPHLRSGNFIGWTQYRKTLTNENRSEFQPAKLLAERTHV